jgi:cyclase
VGIWHDDRMPTVPYTAGLHRLAEATFAYLQPPGSWGWNNAGLVVSGDEALLVDTAWTVELTQRLLDTVGSALPGVRISTLVNTHPNGDHCWGNQLLHDARIVASAATAHGMAEEIGPQAMMSMGAATPPDSPLGRYMRRYFSAFDFTGITLTPAAETFTGQMRLTVGAREAHLAHIGPAHTDGDTIVYVPDADVLFSGDILFIGDHPVMWSGPIGNWVAACDEIIHYGASIVVPGHGPVTDLAGVAAFRGYLERVAELAERHFREGLAYHEAAARIAAEEASLGWGHPERLVLTVGGVYRELGWAEPDDRLAMIGQMAALSELLARP